LPPVGPSLACSLAVIPPTSDPCTKVLSRTSGVKVNPNFVVDRRVILRFSARFRP
jgi:hypothetical protein